MFLPSESVFTELHTNFQNVVEDSWRRRVMIVSPTSLMAILNTVRAVLKDANMREQAGFIQAEVTKLLGDVERMDKRVGNLARHFGNVQDDIKAIQTSSKKVSTRGNRIEEMQFGEETSKNLRARPCPPNWCRCPAERNKEKSQARQPKACTQGTRSHTHKIKSCSGSCATEVIQVVHSFLSEWKRDLKL